MDLVLQQTQEPPVPDDEDSRGPPSPEREYLYHAAYDFLLGSWTPFHNSTSKWLILIYSIICIVISILIKRLAVIKLARLKSHQSINLFGVSIFTVRIYRLIILAMRVNIATNCVHCLMVFIAQYLQETEFDESSSIAIDVCFLVALTGLTQARSLLTSLLDYNILFEFLSLLHLIVSEQDKSIQQLLFLKGQADSTVAEKRRLLRQEKCIHLSLTATSVYVTILRVYGCVPEFFFFRTYTALPIAHLDAVGPLFQVYAVLRAFEAVLLLLVMVPVWPFLIHKMRKHHRSEFRDHGPGFIIYTLTIIFYRLSWAETDIYVVYRVAGAALGDSRVRLSRSYIGFQAFGVFHLFVPLVVVLFKRSKDIFRSFSKIDNLGQASRFQTKRLYSERSGESSLYAPFTLAELDALCRDQQTEAAGFAFNPYNGGTPSQSEGQSPMAAG